MPCTLFFLPRFGLHHLGISRLLRIIIFAWPLFGDFYLRMLFLHFRAVSTNFSYKLLDKRNII